MLFAQSLRHVLQERRAFLIDLDGYKFHWRSELAITGRFENSKEHASFYNAESRLV